jgi:hypothetical protein
MGSISITSLEVTSGNGLRIILNSKKFIAKKKLFIGCIDVGVIQRQEDH